jgi:hypothetical protein
MLDKNKNINSKIDFIDVEHNMNDDSLLKNKKPSYREKLFKEKSNQVEATTTERNKIDLLKDSSVNDNNDTSVDIKTEYCDENIDIKNAYNFNIHGSSFNFLRNSKLTPSTPNCNSNFITPKKPKEEESSEKSNSNCNNNEKDTPMDGKKSENYSKIRLKNPLDPIETCNNFYYEDYYSSDENDRSYLKAIYFKEIMMFKKIEFEKNYELNNNKEIFHTNIIYKNKDSILLLKKDFLYILEIKQKLKEEEIKKPINNDNNPELSLINQLLKEDSLKNIDKKILKYDFDITKPLVCLNFNLLSCKLLLNKSDINNNKKNKYEIQILILGASKKINFYFKNFEIYKKFIYILGSKINDSEGNQTNKLGLSLRTKNFYKDTYIRIRDFEKTAKTGDLLLFRTLDCLSDCQRFFTRDGYDHIAFVIKRNGVIELYEATSNENCSLLEWNAFKYKLYNLIFKRVVLRKLNIDEEDPEKSKEIRENIENKSIEFIDMTLKKKYTISFLKMVIDRKPKEYEISGNWEKGKGYCCSALTAAFYIYNGVMKLEKSVHCIKPGDFEQDRNRVTILPGFSFGPEKIIEFSA